MLHLFRKHQRAISRSVILLFLMSVNVSAWSSTLSNRHAAPGKTHCMQHDTQSAQQSVAHQQHSGKAQHDCCQKNKPCSDICCHSCLLSATPGLALFASVDFTLDYQGVVYSPLVVNAPDGTASSVLYRPPQNLLS